ncbi:MAG: DNA mismatch repair protein MutS [Vicinamibacterales bacterium]
MTGVAPSGEYQRRIAALDQSIAALDRAHLRTSNLRLAAFGAAAVLAWLAFGRGGIGPWWVALPVAAFLTLLVVHARLLNARDRVWRARRYYERGLSRLDGTWVGSGADGARFLDGHHLYARDLDLFGRGSLFQLLNTTRTEAGEQTLADWLRTPAGADEVHARQRAVAELRDRLDFRETLAVLAAEAHVSRSGLLARWAGTEPAGLGPTHAVLFAGCALVTALLVAAVALDAASGAVLLWWLAVPASVALWHKRRIWEVIRRVDAVAADLTLLADLLRVLEQASFEAPRLAVLRSALAGSRRPSDLMRQLGRFVAARDALRNEFVRPFGLLLLVRSQAAVAIDRWHYKHRRSLQAWLTAIGEFEAFASLATHAYEHPSDIVPTIAHDGPVLDATGLGHPLIPEDTVVRNDLGLGGSAPRLLLVSGSNMSGKSTLLRAVGANVVLALAGGTVRATRLTLSPLAIGATMRIQDSLEEGHSRFYSEILRIRDIVDLSRGPVPVLFLLDEILHGTNSHDRRIGAEAIVRTLVEAGGIGLVTTHDLALTALVATLGGRARNVHFEDRLEEGRMCFDYRMRDGVVERSNALELMRAVGITV